MEEIYKIYHKGKIVTWEVSNLGNVKRNGKLIEFDKNSDKYYSFSWYFLHKAVATLFVPNPDNKKYIDHIDTNIHNNRADNLRWCTAKENSNNPITLNRTRNRDFSNFIEAAKKSNIGRKASKETKKKMSDSHKGKSTSLKGTHLSEERKQQIREFMLSDKNPIRGKHLSQEAKNKISESRTGKHYQKLSEAMKGKKHTEEWKENHSNCMKGENNPMYGKSAVKGKHWYYDKSQKKRIYY